MHETAANPAAPWWRSLVVSFGITVLCGSLAAGQQPGGGGSGGKPKAKPAEAAPAKSLEDLLAAALKSNPDIRVAEAKLREAEAELNRTRMQATQKVVTLHRGLEAQKALVESAEAETGRFIELHRTGAVPVGGLETARQKALQAKAKLSEIEAEIGYLSGQQPGGQVRDQAQAALRAVYDYNVFLAHRDWLLKEPKPAAVEGTMAEKIRKALDTLVRIEQGQHLLDVIDHFQLKAGNVPILFNAAEGLNRAVVNVPVRGDLSLAAGLQLIADSYGLRVYVRPYGLLVTGSTQTPPGAVPLHEFWKGVVETQKVETAPKPETEKLQTAPTPDKR